MQVILLDNPTIVDNTSPYVSGGGIIHIVSGAGGHDSGSSLYELPSQPAHQAYQNNTYIMEYVRTRNSIIAFMTINRERLLTSVQFLDNPWMTMDDSNRHISQYYINVDIS